MELKAYNLPDEDLRQSSYVRALGAFTRLFAFSDTKWPELLLPSALRQMEDDLLIGALNLRRVVERSATGSLSEVVPRFTELTGKAAAEYEKSLWVILGRIVHHEMMEPAILRDDNYYSGSAGKIAGFLVCDVKIESDRGSILVNVPGFAIAAANELGRQFKQSA